MELLYEELDAYIELICAGIKIVSVDNQDIFFKHPNALTLVKARRVYELEMISSKKDGLLTNDEMRKIISERNLITSEERLSLNTLKSKLEAQRILLGKTVNVKANQDRLKKIIDDLQNKIYAIESKERSKLAMTAETRSDESKLLYLCWACSYKIDNSDELFWNKYEDFTNEPNLLFRQKIVSEFLSFYSGIKTPIIRAVSRSNLWRIRYVTSLKTSEPLFGVPTSEYSNDQLNLAYWSHYYQSIYEMMPEDQPPDHIISDDDALDAYLKNFYDERTKDTAYRKTKQKRLGKLSAFDQQQVIVTRSNELYEDIKYDTPRESQLIKEGNVKADKQDSRNRIGSVPTNLPRK
jgi:hypothetical protein